MKKTLFSELDLSNEIERALDDMRFDEATPIQAQVIPIMRSGADLIGRSQTGTGKTVAFGIPAIESIITDEDKPTVQVMILCPTRELAQQGAGELRKLAKFKNGIHITEVFGGESMDRQIRSLKRANIVIGTPGRIMDHLRRHTLKLFNLKTVVLDEADEMLSMGFKEDIEVILESAPIERQTALFSATMPKEILALTKKFQNSPQLIEINKSEITLEKIKQSYVNVPMGRKKDAVKLLLNFYQSKCTMIFCNTKKMVDELCDFLLSNGFNAIGLHGDMKQSQRTTALNTFKHSSIEIMVATDVAARGIDVNDVEYVINYDIPQSSEYYVHRIGRTGRAGKDGNTVTICSGGRQVKLIENIAREVKSKITKIDIPSSSDIMESSFNKGYSEIEKSLNIDTLSVYKSMVSKLEQNGYLAADIAAAALQLYFGNDDYSSEVNDLSDFSKKEHKATPNKGYAKILINIGRNSHVAPNHIVGAITERTGITGASIGKIEIYDERTIVSIANECADEVLDKMIGCKICSKSVKTTLFEENSKRKRNKSYEKNTAIKQRSSNKNSKLTLQKKTQKKRQNNI